MADCNSSRHHGCVPAGGEYQRDNYICVFHEESRSVRKSPSRLSFMVHQPHHVPWSPITAGGPGKYLPFPAYIGEVGKEESD